MEIRYWFQAAGLQYEDYRHSPIYRAHCVTANFMARCLRDRYERLNAGCQTTLRHAFECFDRIAPMGKCIAPASSCHGSR